MVGEVPCEGDGYTDPGGGGGFSRSLFRKPQPFSYRIIIPSICTPTYILTYLLNSFP